MDVQLYEYSGETWGPCTTEGNGNCFFHAAFGVRVVDGHPFVDKHANFRRSYWSTFLKYFQNEDMPPPLKELLDRCFVAKGKDIEIDYEEYIRDVALPDYWVLVEEIPILATIDNIKIVLFMSERATPEVFEPRPQLLGNFPFRCTGEFRKVVMRLRESHFERLLSYRQQAEEEVLQEEVVDVEDFNETIYISNEWYPKTGSAGVKGGWYQIDLLTILLLKGLTMAPGWRLSTENTLAGNKWDDAVFEYAGEYEGHVLIQAKHKENETISYESLMLSGYEHSFNIAKYFIAFQEIRNRFNIKQLVICTNAGLRIDDRLQKIIKEEPVLKENILFFQNVTKVCYSLTEDAVPLLKKQAQKHYESKLRGVKLCICEEDIKRFLSLLRIFTNYLDEKNRKSIAIEAVSKLPLAQNLDVMQVFEYVKKKVSNWFERELKSPYLRTYEANAFFCDIYSLRYVDILKQYELRWKNNHLPPSFCEQPKEDKKSIKRSGKNSSYEEISMKQILHIVPQHDHILSAVRVFEALQKQIHCVLFLNTSDSSFVQQHIVEAFAVPHYVYLVIASPRTLNKRLVQRILFILKKTYKKVIVIADAGNEFATALKKMSPSLFETITDVITFDNLSTEIAANMQKKYIIFQGRNIHLEDLVGLNALNDIVDGEMLARLSKKGENVVVGDEVKHSDENMKSYYIDRNFNREEQISEDQMRLSEERVVLISDPAGMGKSTVLASLAIAVKETYPHLWVIRVDLNSYSRIFKEYLKRNRQKIDLLELLNSHKATELKSEFEKRLFRVRAKVVLMIDAVDEVSPSYMNMVMALLEDCKTLINIARVFVTTRPHLCQTLEEILEVTAYNLEPFSEINQVAFLTRYWIQYLKLEEVAQKERCRLYADALIKKMSEWINEKSEETFAGIPLQTRMLAEVFQERTHDEQWEGCKEFLLSREDQPSLPTRINLIQLYEMFIEKKRYIFVNDKGKANQLSELVLIETFDKCRNIYRVLALEVLFHPFECEFFSIYKNRQTNYLSREQYLVRIGIVGKPKDGQLHFIHRTFAEYYAAECFLEELKLASNNERLKKFFLNEVILREEYYVVRAFLDSFLDRELPSLPDATLEEYSLLDYMAIYSLSNSKNTLLHTIAGEGNIGFLRFFLTCAYFGIRNNREREIEDRVLIDVPDLYLATPLHEAAARGHLIIVKELLENGANIDSIDADGYTSLHEAAVVGHADVVEFLMEKGAKTGIRNSYGETAVHLAAQAGHLNVVKLLVRQGSWAEVNNAIEDNPALHLATYRGHLEIVKFLIEEADVDINTTDTTGSTALHAAAQEHHIHIVEYLVEKGANATILNERNRSPFEDALYGSNLELALVLLKYMGRLVIEESNGVMRELIELLENGATIGSTDADGNTSLHEAAAAGHADVVEFLMEKGAKTGTRNSYGETAVHLAAQAGHLNVVKLLVRQGSWAEVNNAIEDNPALHLAAYRGHLEIVKFLIEEAGVDINTTDTTGSTALHAAAQERHLNVVEYLVQKGANATILNERNRSPFDDAIYGGNLELALVLLKYVGRLVIKEANGEMHQLVVSGIDDEVLMSLIRKIYELYFQSDDDDDDNNADNTDIDHVADSSNSDDGTDTNADTDSTNKDNDDDDNNANNIDIDHVADSSNSDDGTDTNTDTDSTNKDNDDDDDNNADNIDIDHVADSSNSDDGTDTDSSNKDNDDDADNNVDNIDIGVAYSSNTDNGIGKNGDTDSGNKYNDDSDDKADKDDDNVGGDVRDKVTDYEPAEAEVPLVLQK